MGWKLLISYLWRVREKGDSRSGSWDPLPLPLPLAGSRGKYGPGSPAFRRKGLLRRLG